MMHRSADSTTVRVMSASYLSFCSILVPPFCSSRGNRHGSWGMEIIDSHTPPSTTDRAHLLSLPTCAGGVPSARVLRSLLFLRGLYIVFSFRILHKMFHIDPDGEGCRGMVDPLVRVYRSSPRRSRERRNGSTTHLDSCAPARVVERPPGVPGSQSSNITRPLRLSGHRLQLWRLTAAHPR